MLQMQIGKKKSTSPERIIQNLCDFYTWKLSQNLVTYISAGSVMELLGKIR